MPLDSTKKGKTNKKVDSKYERNTPEVDIIFRESVSELDLAYFIFDNTPSTTKKRNSIFIPLDDEELFIKALIKPEIETKNYVSMAAISQYMQKSYCFNTDHTKK